MKSRNRKRGSSRMMRSFTLDVAKLQEILLHRSLSARIAAESGMSLVNARAYPCADGSFTLRVVWRSRKPGLECSIAETFRGLRGS
jgi:hypothetical protein